MSELQQRWFFDDHEGDFENGDDVDSTPRPTAVAISAHTAPLMILCLKK